MWPLIWASLCVAFGLSVRPSLAQLFKDLFPSHLDSVIAVLLSLALVLGLELSLRTHLKSLALALALKVESLLALILNIFY